MNIGKKKKKGEMDQKINTDNIKIKKRKVSNRPKAIKLD